MACHVVVAVGVCVMPRPIGSRNRARKLVERNGYLAAFEPMHPLANSDGYVLHHRMVAWDHGILTNPAMHVHHKDHDRRNNDPSNLVAMWPSDHHRLHAHDGGVVVNQHGAWPLSEGDCSIDGCTRSAETRGWCNGHYIRWRRSGDPLGSATIPKREAS